MFMTSKLFVYVNFYCMNECFTFRTESFAGEVTAARERQNHKVSCGGTQQLFTYLVYINIAAISLCFLHNFSHRSCILIILIFL